MRTKLVFTSVSIGLLIAILFSEFLVRLFARNLPNTNWERELFCKNAQLNYRFMKPGVSGYQTSFAFPGGVWVRSNSNGYRDSEWAEKRNSGKTSLMLLGDSFGWGWGCHQDSMMTRTIEGQLNFSVYNLCIPGDNLLRQYLRYQYHIDEIDADQLVILNYINDFFDINAQVRQIKESKQKNLLSKGRLGPITCDPSAAMTPADLLQYSHLFRLVNQFRNSNRFSVNTEQGRKLLDSLFKIGYQPDVDLLTDSTSYQVIRSFYRELLRDISIQKKVLVVYIPPDYQIDQSRYAHLQRLFPDQKITPEIINAMMRDITEGIPNLTFVDLTDQFRKFNSQTPLYITFDGHLNARGQQLAGKLIAEELKKQ